ncbi:hypothetical protein DV515_00016686, partial [Chloebia gouldiae]
PLSLSHPGVPIELSQCPCPSPVSLSHPGVPTELSQCSCPIPVFLSHLSDPLELSQCSHHTQVSLLSCPSVPVAVSSLPSVPLEKPLVLHPQPLVPRPQRRQGRGPEHPSCPRGVPGQGRQCQRHPQPQGQPQPPRPSRHEVAGGVQRQRQEQEGQRQEQHGGRQEPQWLQPEPPSDAAPEQRRARGAGGREAREGDSQRDPVWLQD